MKTHDLTITYGTSRGRDTYGYTLVQLFENGRKVTSTCGGGYDMRGTVCANWLEKTYQDTLRNLLRHKTHYIHREGKSYETRNGRDNFYGSTLHTETNAISLDGGCGFESIRQIAKAIGLEVRTVDAGKKRDVIIVTDTRATP